jgi:hypothetical protein
MKKILIAIAVILMGVYLFVEHGIVYLKKEHIVLVEPDHWKNGQITTFLETNEASANTNKISKLEKAEFFAKVQSTMQEIKSMTITIEDKRKKLSDLNTIGIAGVKAIINELSKVNWSDSEVQLDLALVDYLKYRIKWDEKTRSLVSTVIQEARPKTNSPRDQAVWVANRVELLEALAAVDLDKATQIVKVNQDKFYRDQLEYGVLANLLDQGLSQSEAKQVLKRYL